MKMRAPLAVLLASIGLFGCPASDDDDEAPRDGGSATRDGGPAEERDAGPRDGGGEEPIGFALHYHRADDAASSWSVEISGDVTAGTIEAASGDDFGAVFAIPLNDGATTFSYQFKNGAEVDPPTPVMVTVASAPDGVWHFSGRAAPLLYEPPVIPGDNQVVVHYIRKDTEYTGWGLHVWGDVERETQWTAPLISGGVDPTLGSYFEVDVAAGGDRVNLIVHMGDLKDPGPDMGFDISELGDMVWVLTGSTEIFPYPVEPPAFAIDGARAHWFTSDTFGWDPIGDPTQVELRYSETADVEVVDADVEGGEVVALMEDMTGLPPAVQLADPHLRTLRAWKIDPAANLEVADALKGQLVLVARDAAGVATDATTIQIPRVLDELYTYAGPLGATFEGSLVPTITLWAPTAQTVRLIRFDDQLAMVETLDMLENPASGTWNLTGDVSWYGGYYQYEVTVFHPITGDVETLVSTDPYSVSTSRNGRHSQIIDLEDPATMPVGWDATTKPALGAPEDIVIYESHIRDFSAFDATVEAADRGTYAAFTYTGQGGTTRSDGMSHLLDLQAAGLTHLHLLPAFDIATVNEDASARVCLDDGFDRLCAANANVPAEDCTTHGTTPIRDVLAGFDPTGPDAQEVLGWMRSYDAFNWGYDPLHYNVPEGSYASDPQGVTRIVEFREMVKAVSESGLRVVMDVVYNHTNASGIGPNSVLDKVVPGYYHRLNTETGFVEKSTCCDNTATEHAMMERLMIDSLVLWAKHYKIDAFRFDLMGHHMKRNMEAALAAVQALTIADDGVDGSKIYFYGEGWNFGEVMSNLRGRNATQANMAGTGIGTFSDRLRDAVRGGGPFDGAAALRANQGFINGLFYDPVETAGDPATTKAALLLAADQIRVGMAGNLKTFLLTDRRGSRVSGNLVTYNGEPAGYTDDPQEVITYVSKHDNQTLFDINAYKTPAGTSMDDRVRIQNLGVSITGLGQGIPFYHMGVDLLRSKSMERDSFDSGDWYNRVDWTYTTNNWNVGLPREDKDGDNWPLIQTILADTSIAPETAHIQRAVDHFQEILAVRKSSPLFRLRTGDEVKTRVHYLNTGVDQIPGLIVQTITDGTCATADLDAAYDALVVMINANDEAQTFDIAGATGFELHPVLAASTDTVVAGASFSAGTFSVPGRTAAVFVLPQSGAQGAGLPCNPL